MDKLFPQYLDFGSSGPAVALLQCMLLFASYNTAIVPDGKYGEQTAHGVRNLQKSLGFTGGDVDGNFGPKTRLALFHAKGIDVNALCAEDFHGETTPAPMTAEK